VHAEIEAEAEGAGKRPLPSRSQKNLQRAELIGASLTWKRAGTGWRLFNKSRCFGDVVPDSKYPNMWRIVLHDGRLSDMANLSWARSAVMDAAVRELAYEARSRGRAFSAENGAVFQGKRSLVRRNRSGAT
jgi:hypothetical protein